MADIDLPPSSSWDNTFSSTAPLPFRVLFLTFATILGFASNLHLLAYLGIDTALVLDIRLDDYRSTSTSTGQFVHPSRLYPPVYALAAIGLAWTTAGSLLFGKLTGGVPEEMVRWRGVPAAIALVVGLATVAPWNVLYKRERMMFLRSLRRTILSPLYSAVPFCDIILADILTSSAKVLGDVWVSGCLVATETKRFGLEGEDTGAQCARVFMVPVMTSLPYLFRFRQCISEVVTGSTPTPKRSTMNALKYASAFPVIILSAMQGVVGDPFEEEDREGAWIDRGNLFALWVLAVLVNSFYSFWWDVTNDWGLSLLLKSGWSQTPSYTLLPTGPSSRRSASHSRGRSNALPPSSSATSNGHLMVPGDHLAYPPPPSRPMSPTVPASPPKTFPAPHPPSSSSSSSSTPRPRSHHSRAFSTAASPNVSYPFLRPILLLPDPTIYYLAIAIDFVLRFTWSLKLSSHLHSIHEIESGIFLMEALEVVRRWMWVYLRIEWEAVRKGGGGLVISDSEGRLRAEEEGGVAGYRDEASDGEEVGMMLVQENLIPAGTGVRL